MQVLLIVLLIVVLLALRVPVGIALAAGGSLGLYLMGGSTLLKGILQSAPSMAASYSLTPIPLFILMAQFVLAAGAMTGIFKAAQIWVGRVRGGTGVATTLSGAVFGAVSGSTTAAAATLARTTCKELINEGYNPKIATGLVAVAGTLAAMVPPSIILIFYAVLAEVSVARVLIAGFLPAVLVTLAIIVTLVIIMAIRPEYAPRGTAYSFREKLASAPSVLPVLFLFGIVIGTMYFGIATPTESAALGALGAFLLYATTKNFSWQGVGKALVDATRASVMILLIIIGAAILGYFITMSGVAQAAVDLVSAIQAPALVIIVVIAIFYIILGFFMEQMAILALTVPIVLPVIMELGYDPIWFGVFVVLLAEIGLVSPPLGLNVFVVSRAADRDAGEVFVGALPFVVSILAVVALFAVFPEMALWLPNSLS
ncbi:TRAP transporter large permease [Nesterenkonia muleiensis]|uniref:TRAP transporter large permease n=1 Tax=Nesterenkonia muleiensis TaxID=2282648 RepID=UPI000E75402E|nr:TRAP transporter large permease [Nesterenkonia muleiensis]